MIDADHFTRNFYDSFEMTLEAPIFLPQPEIIVHEREIPPPTGFGSEQDSMRSVNGSLLPGPIPAKKLGENKVLSFFCKLLSGGVDDEQRRFVISYYLVDNTVKIVEPPIRNSGFTGTKPFISTVSSQFVSSVFFNVCSIDVKLQADCSSHGES